MIKSDQTRTADRVLELLENIDTGVILAGGAPRDWYLKNPARDLDFYIFYPEIGNEQFTELLEIHLGVPVSIKGETENLYGDSYRNPELLAVWDFEYDGIPCQVMRMVDVIDRCAVQSFALDICRVWYKGGRIHTTKEFLESVDHKIIRIMKPLYYKGDAYIQKIVSKYPDFLFVEK